MSAMYLVGTSYEEYADIDDAVNFSTLKVIERSPLHYLYAKENARKDTVALTKGRAVHTLTLEPHRFDDQYAIFPGKVRNGDYWTAFKAASEGRSILRPSEKLQAETMANAVLSDLVAGPLFLEGEGDNEVVIVWTDPATGIRCKARLDRISYTHSAIVDLKSAADVRSRIVGATAAKMFYPQQLRFYREGLDVVRRELGLPVIDWSEKLASVEIAPPHAVAVDYLDERARFVASESNARLLATLAECIATDNWPGPATAERPLQQPAYALQNSDEDDAYEGLNLDGIDDDEESEAA